MKRGHENRNDDDIVSITYVDQKYRVPVGVMRKIPRFELLLQDNPEVEAIHFNELDMGATASMLRRHVPPVDVDMNDPQTTQEDEVWDLCKQLITTKNANQWPRRLTREKFIMLTLDICIIDDCNTFDVSFVGQQDLLLLKKSILNACRGYNKRLVQLTKKDIHIFKFGYSDENIGTELYLFTCETCIYDTRAFFTLRFKEIK